ncbi:MAG: cytochrome c3 family protein [Thermodesulfovibrionales bacterium]
MKGTRLGRDAERVLQYLKNAVVLAGICLASLLGNPETTLNAGIVTTMHNLSISGPGPVKATTEQRVCVFCHTPHGSTGNLAGINVPIWNHSLSSASYSLYSSPTLLSPTSPAIQPDGSSRLCLCCHDGTVAIGAVVNTGTAQNTISMIGTAGGGVMPAGTANMGTDISGHHPVSIEVNTSLINDKGTQCTEGLVAWRICTPQPGIPVTLSRTNNRYGSSNNTGVGVQCTSCHDAHADPNPGTTMFLTVGDINNLDPLCLACHLDCSLNCP